MKRFHEYIVVENLEASIGFYSTSRPATTELDDDLPDTRHADDEILHHELAACLEMESK